MTFDHAEIIEIIHKSQHCQRNWDLSKEIPEDDLNLIITAATQCPSKQNIAHYNLHVITNREKIEKIHSHTIGFRGVQTNPQVLANVLIIIEIHPVEEHRNSFSYISMPKEKQIEAFSRDAYMAVGIATGYINLTSNLLGYYSGCCACFDNESIKRILGLENDILLMIGIGYKNDNLNRRVHHLDPTFIFPTIKKEDIKVSFYR
jgi:nitroreductase